VIRLCYGRVWFKLVGVLILLFSFSELVRQAFFFLSTFESYRFWIEANHIPLTLEYTSALSSSRVEPRRWSTIRAAIIGHAPARCLQISIWRTPKCRLNSLQRFPSFRIGSNKKIFLKHDYIKEKNCLLLH
jgi:hypothetical protein